MSLPFYVDEEGVLRNSSDGSERPFDCVAAMFYATGECLLRSGLYFFLEWTEKDEPVFVWTVGDEFCRFAVLEGCVGRVRIGGDTESDTVYEGKLSDEDVWSVLEDDFSLMLLTPELRSVLTDLGVFVV
jgi:hypothetical protein